MQNKVCTHTNAHEKQTSSSSPDIPASSS